MLIPILLGSEKDREFTKKITMHLDELEIPYKIHVASAHKVPELVLKIVGAYNASKKVICYITVVGRSNGLSGVVAANSIHPCIACPPFQDKEDIMLNLYSTVMMPTDTPVLTVLDPQNAAYAAAKIVSLTDQKLRKKIEMRIQKVKKTFY